MRRNSRSGILDLNYIFIRNSRIPYKKGGKTRIEF